MAERGHFSDDKKCGGGKPGSRAQFAHGRVIDLLMRRGRARDERAWSVSLHPGIEQPESGALVVRTRHVDHQSGAGGGESTPVVFRIFVETMAAEKYERRGNVALGERNLGGGSGAQSGGDSGNDFKSDPVLAQCFNLFASPSEDERVSSFEPDHL